jgi:vacuolar-type H+-ATPase subunit H
MTSAIEQTVKALTEFEAELDVAKAGAGESRKRMVRDAVELSDSAAKVALDKARSIASETVERARKEAESEADSIRKKGRSTLDKYGEVISKNKREAVEHVVRRLLGEQD